MREESNEKMKETIQGTMVLVILCVMSILLIWGLSSPPTTIEFPLLSHSEPVSSDVLHTAADWFFCRSESYSLVSVCPID